MPVYNPSRKQRTEELGKAGASERPRENSGPGHENTGLGERFRHGQEEQAKQQLQLRNEDPPPCSSPAMISAQGQDQGARVSA